VIEIIEPEQFSTIPWKNGLGETTELAINNAGTLDKFDWRLSIASVVTDGLFSDFSDYQRNLVLIAGQGIMLTHDDKTVDNLTNLLDIANFDGASKTYGKLTNGSIKDFNIITNKHRILPQVSCHTGTSKVTLHLAKSSLYFAYSLTGKMDVEIPEQQKTIVPQGHLLKLSFAEKTAYKDKYSLKINGKDMILIELQQIAVDAL